MKASPKPGTLAALTALAALMLALFTPASAPAASQEKEGLRITVTESTLDRETLRKGPRAEVDVAVKTLRTTVRNSSMKPLPPGNVSYVILVRRAFTEKIRRQTFRVEGTEPVPELTGGREAVLALGAFELRDRNLKHSDADDEVAGWRMIFTLGDKNITFESDPNFVAMESAAASAQQGKQGAAAPPTGPGEPARKHKPKKD
jgi:hypothetical protein